MAGIEEIKEQVVDETEDAVPDYSVDMNDPRLTQINAEEQQKLGETEAAYQGMINSSDSFFNDQIKGIQEWEAKQTENQQNRTDFTIATIEQQKAQAKKDYTKEQSGAFIDWQKQSNAYGAEAEKMASAGLTNSGYSESSQVSMYNTYQNRVATAREVFSQAVLNYDNAIKDAMLTNNEVLAQIASDSLFKQTEIAMQGFMYKNDLTRELESTKLAIGQHYDSQWMNMLGQINTENSLKENVRQFESDQKWKTEQAELDRQQQRELNQENQRFQAEQNEKARQHDIDMESVNHNNRMAEIYAQGSYGPDGGIDIDDDDGKTYANPGSITSQKAAMDYMKAQGVPKDYYDDVLSKEQWDKQRDRYLTKGTGSSAVKNYSSYQDYATDFVNYAIENYT